MVVATGPIHTPSAIVVVPAAIVVPSAIIVIAAIVVIAVLLWPLSSIVSLPERRPGGYAADHGGEDERHQYPTDD